MSQNNNFNIFFDDIYKSNSTIESIYSLSIKFENYKIKRKYIYGIGKRKNFDFDTLFNENNKIDLILNLMNIGKDIYQDKCIKKYYLEGYQYQNKNEQKPHINIEINKLNKNIKEKIIAFFTKYGIIGSRYCNLENFMRRVLDFYCTTEIWNLIEQNDIENIEEELLFIIYPQYRKRSKEDLCRGIAMNIQEKGLLKNENTVSVFDYFYYDAKKKSFNRIELCNDYITLAYHQLAHIILLKDTRIILPRCKICGEYLDYKRISKMYCDSEECKKIRQKQRTAKSRYKYKKE